MNLRAGQGTEKMRQILQSKIPISLESGKDNANIKEGEKEEGREVDRGVSVALTGLREGPASLKHFLPKLASRE